MASKFVLALFLCFASSLSIYRTNGIVINEGRIFDKFLFEFDEPVFNEEINICMSNIKFVLGEAENANVVAGKAEDIRNEVSEGKVFTVIYKDKIGCICRWDSRKKQYKWCLPSHKEKVMPVGSLGRIVLHKKFGTAGKIGEIEEIVEGVL